MRVNVFTDERNEDGRNFLLVYEGAPYYVKPMLWKRWGVAAWCKWAIGLPLPGDDGGNYCPEGYYTPDLGPKYYEGKEREDMEVIKEDLRKQRTGQCQF